jgi:hypothetical protein
MLSREMRTPGRTTLLLFLFFQALYALTSSGNAFRVPDEFEVYFQVEHLVDAGDLSVPQTLTIRTPVVRDGQTVGSERIFFGEVGRDGRPYAPYGPLAAVLALPHHLVARAVAWIAGVPRSPLPGGLAWVFLVGGLTMTATATAAVLAVAGFHRAVLALETPQQPALVLSMLLGGATVLWPYGTSFYSEAWQAAAFAWAAAALLEARRTSRLADASAPRRARQLVGLAALLLAVAGLTKTTSLVFAPGFVVAALCDRFVPPRRRLGAAAVLGLGIALATAIHVSWNGYRFGRPFDFGYGWNDMIPQLPPRQFLAADVPFGLAVLLFSPGKSIVLWAPALLLAAARAKTFWRREPGAALGLACSAVVGLIFFAAYLFPEGGYAHGARNLVPLVPLLLLPAAGPTADGGPCRQSPRVPRPASDGVAGDIGVVSRGSGAHRTGVAERATGGSTRRPGARGCGIASTACRLSRRCARSDGRGLKRSGSGPTSFRSICCRRDASCQTAGDTGVVDLDASAVWLAMAAAAGAGLIWQCRFARGQRCTGPSQPDCCRLKAPLGVRGEVTPPSAG